MGRGITRYMQETAPLKSGVTLFYGVWFDAYYKTSFFYQIIPIGNRADKTEK